MGEYEGGRRVSDEPFSALPWLLVAKGSLEGGSVTLDRDESRHLKGALRRRIGDQVVLSDGAGFVAVAVIESLTGAGAKCEPLEIQHRPSPSGHGVIVGLGVLHGRAMDWAVQKAVEVGVRLFVPVIGERSQLDRRASAGRQPHWRRVARQALKQCRRVWAMEVSQPCALEDFLLERGPGMVACAQGAAFGDLPRTLASVLLVGPEGGFTETESGSIERRGWKRLRLGPHVLRAETALVLGAGVMVAREELQDDGGAREED